MDEHRLRDLLAKVSVGHVSVDEAVTALRRLPFEDLGYANVDHHRAIRQGFPEVVFCQGKTIPQVVGIVKALYARASIVLATRAAPEVLAILFLEKYSPLTFATSGEEAR